MKCSDEELLEAYLATRSYTKTAAKLGVSKQGIDDRLRRMRAAGIHVPFTGNKLTGSYKKYTPERVVQLNEFIQERTQ